VAHLYAKNRIMEIKSSQINMMMQDYDKSLTSLDYTSGLLTGELMCAIPID